MVKEPNPPKNLTDFQRDFSKSLTTPYDFSTGRVEHQHSLYKPCLLSLIETQGERTAAEHFDVYNQQYWFRLFTAMQSDFPLLRHTLSAWGLNQLVTVYLTKYPSEHPSLNQLTDHFLEFMSEDHCWNTPLNREIIAIESAFVTAFSALQEPGLIPLSEEELSLVGGERLLFQKPFTLLHESWDILENRALVFKDSEDTITPHFKKVNGWWALYQYNDVLDVIKLSEIEYALLHLLYKGTSLEKALAVIFESLEPHEQKHLLTMIPIWFKRWVFCGLIIGHCS
ncbi:MAG: DNA-binding domain-containing protein [Fibrobacterales bacterium]